MPYICAAQRNEFYKQQFNLQANAESSRDGCQHDKLKLTPACSKVRTINIYIFFTINKISTEIFLTSLKKIYIFLNFPKVQILNSIIYTIQLFTFKSFLFTITFIFPFQNIQFILLIILNSYSNKVWQAVGFTIV